MKSLTNHPLGKQNKLQTLKRYFAFHFNHSIMSKPPKVYKFVNDIKFFGDFESGIVGNIYYGLNDYEDMSFVLHFLRKNDIFVDIGANCGSYTLLAAGVANARTISIEPVKDTYKFLLKNLQLNSLDKKVFAINIGLSSSSGSLRFSKNKGLMNRVTTDNKNNQNTEEIEVTTLDELIKNEFPNLLKIDVEGFEFEVLRGATQTLQSNELKAIIIELNNSGTVYGYTDQEVHEILINYGFKPYEYNPKNRSLMQLSSFNLNKFNTIYVKNSWITFVEDRIENAEPFHVLDKIF